MTNTMIIETDIKNMEISSALRKVAEMLDGFDKRLTELEQIIVGKSPSKIKTDVDDLDGSVASVQMRLKHLEENQMKILGLKG